MKPSLIFFMNLILIRFTVPSENWDDDFEGLSIGAGEFIVPQAIQERQQQVILHLDSVKEFAALVEGKLRYSLLYCTFSNSDEDLKKLMDLAVSSGVRWGAYRKMWDEAEGIIALASTGMVDDGSKGKTQKDSDVQQRMSLELDFSDEEDDVKVVLKEESRSTTITHTARRASILLPDDDVFGGAIYTSPTARHSKSIERLSARHSKTFPATSVESRAATKPSDPLAMAKVLMERMQNSAEVARPGSSSSSIGPKGGKVQFDGGMLGPLLEKVRNLLSNLETAVKEEGNHTLASASYKFELGIEYGGTGVTVI